MRLVKFLGVVERDFALAVGDQLTNTGFRRRADFRPFSGRNSADTGCAFFESLRHKVSTGLSLGGLLNYRRLERICHRAGTLKLKKR
jgi:hypothetical protein